MKNNTIFLSYRAQRNVQTKVVEKKKINIYIFLNLAVYDIMRKNLVETERA